MFDLFGCKSHKERLKFVVWNTWSMVLIPVAILFFALITDWPFGVSNIFKNEPGFFFLAWVLGWILIGSAVRVSDVIHNNDDTFLLLLFKRIVTMLFCFVFPIFYIYSFCMIVSGQSKRDDEASC